MYSAAVTLKSRLKGKSRKKARKHHIRKLGKIDNETRLLNHSKSWELGEYSGSTLLNNSLHLEEKADRGSGIVFYSDDQYRFSQQYSLKLKIGTLYNVCVIVHKNEMLMKFSVGGKTYNCFKKFEQNDKSDQDFVGFAFVWCTETIRTTKRNHRSVLPCSMKFRGRREIHFNLLTKFYENYNSRLYVGNPLTSVDLQIQADREMIVTYV